MARNVIVADMGYTQMSCWIVKGHFFQFRMAPESIKHQWLPLLTQELWIRCAILFKSKRVLFISENLCIPDAKSVPWYFANDWHFLKGQPFLVILRYLSCWLYHPPRSITALCQQRGVSSVFGFLPLQIFEYTSHLPPPPVNLRMPHIAQIEQDPSKGVPSLKALQFSHKKITSIVGFWAISFQTSALKSRFVSTFKLT